MTIPQPRAVTVSLKEEDSSLDKATLFTYGVPAKVVFFFFCFIIFSSFLIQPSWLKIFALFTNSTRHFLFGKGHPSWCHAWSIRPVHCQAQRGEPFLFAIKKCVLGSFTCVDCLRTQVSRTGLKLTLCWSEAQSLSLVLLTTRPRQRPTEVELGALNHSATTAPHVTLIDFKWPCFVVVIHSLKKKKSLSKFQAFLLYVLHNPLR